MDDADRAEIDEQRQRDIAIANARQLTAKHLIITDRCLNCGEIFPPDTTPRSRWCDADCRDDWMRRTRQ